MPAASTATTSRIFETLKMTPLARAGNAALRAAWCKAHAAKGVREDQAKQKDADGVIPVIEFETPLIFAGKLLGVGPGTPSEHGDEAEEDGNG
jgi:hypothetical protein